MKNQKNFTAPKLCTCNGDITKSWYVYFYYTDLRTNKKTLFRYKLGINRLKTKRERENEAIGIIVSLTNRLNSGWNPLDESVEPTSSVNQIITEALDNVLDAKQSYITARSYKTYYDQLNLFKKWLKKNSLNNLYAHNFTAMHARSYFDYLLKEKKYSGKTYNGHLTFLRTFFNFLLEREIVDANPISGIKCVRQDKGKNTAYSKAEEQAFKKYVYKIDPYFFYSAMFVKYCFLRRSELSCLKIKHINWENHTIIIPSENAKSRIQDSVTIPKTLEQYIIEMDILNKNPEYYIFGKNIKTSKDKLRRVDDLSDRQRHYNRELGIKKECTFYSWKHTGVVELYNRTKDPYIVMRQCRHSDIKMTMVYLRSLGCGVNELVREW